MWNNVVINLLDATCLCWLWEFPYFESTSLYGWWYLLLIRLNNAGKDNVLLNKNLIISQPHSLRINVNEKNIYGYQLLLFNLLNIIFMPLKPFVVFMIYHFQNDRNDFRDNMRKMIYYILFEILIAFHDFYLIYNL